MRINGGKGDQLMAKRTSRVVWGLAAVLAVLVLARIIVLCSPYGILLRRQEWGFGRADIITSDGFTRGRQRFIRLNECIKLGIVAIRRPLSVSPSGFDPQRHGASLTK
jgi:hypothetical protein